MLTRPFRATYVGRIDVARIPYDLRVAARIYASLLAPLEQNLGGVTRLLLSPDGFLHAIPFDALVTGEVADPRRVDAYHAARYLVDRFEVVYLPSARFVGGGDSALPRTGRMLAVANGVSGGDQELAVIRSAWLGKVNVLSDALATESAVRRASTGITVLHLATHAIADDRDPLATHLRLAPDEASDGLMHIPEISAARISARLVVLSGCETLRGPLYDGEGFMGLARAFLIGGARSVAATQWPVGPETADIMRHFYRHLAAGRDPVGALRMAKLAMRDNAPTANPFFWAGYVMVKGG